MSASKILPEGKAYACPVCKKPMFPDKSFDVLHCAECWRSVDLWYDKVPEVIDGEVPKVEIVWKEMPR